MCKDIDTGELHIFRKVTEDVQEGRRFVDFISRCSCIVGHNLLGYDLPVCTALLGIPTPDIHTLVDTLILSKLIDYSRDGHSIEDYGLEFGIPKGKFVDFSRYSQEMEDYCVRDVEICCRIYDKYRRYVGNPDHRASILLEHRFQGVVNALHDNGFGFNTAKATKLLVQVTEQLTILDKDILEAFPPKLRLIREITPKETKYGTLSKTDFRWHDGSDLSAYNGGPFCRCSWESFNPSSHKQIIAVLNQAGWRPVDKTTTHIDTERELNRLKYTKSKDTSLDLRKKELIVKLEGLKSSGWKVSEPNLETLPDPELLILWKDKCRIKVERNVYNINEIITQDTLIENEPKLSRTIIKIQDVKKIDNSERITEFLLKILRDVLPNRKDVARFVEDQQHLWSIIVTPTDCYVDCSASFATDTWAGMRDLQSLQTTISQLQAAKTLAKRILLESRRRTLVEWLELASPGGRIHGKFLGIGAWTHRMAHQNPNTANIPNEFDTAGKKKLLGKELRSLWCAPRNRLLVGVDAEGIQLRIFAHLINDPEFTKALVEGKKDDKTDPHSLNQSILGPVCKSRQAAKRFIYALLLGAGLGKLAEILGCDEASAKSALQNLLARYEGFAYLKETIIPVDARRGWFSGIDGRRVRIPGDTEGSRKHLAMSGYLQSGEAIVIKAATLKWIDKLKDDDAMLVNFVHDEWQTECPNNMEIALRIAKMQADSLREVGEELKLNCPLAGSYYNDDLKDYTIHTNWSKTH